MIKQEIALHDAEMEHIKNKTFPNLALMKISAYHKAKGDNVEWWFPFKKYDKVYSSKVFSFTPENQYLPPDTIKGGTGYGLFNELPHEIDNCNPDYSIYPNCDYAIGFITRGCPNVCNYCIVSKKEGNIHSYNTWGNIVRDDTNKLVLLDNNILACDYGISQLEELSKTDYRIDLNQGMDITRIDDEVCKILKNLKWIKYIRFSCDKTSQIKHFENANALFKKHGISASKIFVYLLVRKDLYNANFRVRALHRINPLWSIYAQAERNSNENPTPAMLEFAQRYVYGRSYKKENWFQYLKRQKQVFNGFEIANGKAVS